MRSLWMRDLHSVPSRVLWNKTTHKIITDHQDRLDDEDLLDEDRLDEDIRLVAVQRSVQHEGSLTAAICSTMYPETRRHQ
jgi:hypothetical protein